jgi:hypothetical protein
MMNKEANSIHALCRYGGCVEEMSFLCWPGIFYISFWIFMADFPLFQEAVKML